MKLTKHDKKEIEKLLWLKKQILTIPYEQRKKDFLKAMKGE